MQIQMRVVVAIGAAYFIGYSRGVTASQNLGAQINEGLNKVGEGLKDIAVEIGVDYKKSQEDKKEFDRLVVDRKDAYTVEEKVVRMGRRRDLYRTDEQIAERLDTTVEDVKRILAEDGPPDIEGEEAAEFPDPDDVDTTENRQKVINELEPPIRSGSNAN